jgi:hypothetical protein
MVIDAMAAAWYRMAHVPTAATFVFGLAHAEGLFNTEVTGSSMKPGTGSFPPSSWSIMNATTPPLWQVDARAVHHACIELA